MMRIEVLASGSTGNCTYIEAGKHKILIDVGISKKCIELELQKLNTSLEEIDTLLITHEHDDHIRSFGSVIRYDNLTCYMTRGTYQGILKNKACTESFNKLVTSKIEDGSIILLNRLENSILYQDLFLDDLEIKVLPTFHDALEPVGYKIQCENKNIVYITDTGYVHQKLYPIISDADCYVLECNHDPYILQASSRPYSLKMRILSDHGHLSNEDAFVTLAHVLGEHTHLVFYAHISQECNLTEIIEITRKKVMSDLGIDTKDISFVVTSPLPTKVFDL